MAWFRALVTTCSLAISCGAISFGVLGLPPAWAQPDRVEMPGESAKLLDDVRRQVERGRAQLEANQLTARDTLRVAARQSLDTLVSYVGPEVLTAPPERMPRTGLWAAATRLAAEAHYWWGRAADQSGRRDEAVTAFARAVRFAGRLRPGAPDSLPRDALLGLGGALREGLPLVAPDDILTTVAESAHGRLWSPRRFEVLLPTPILAPRRGDAPVSLIAPEKREFLVTSGRVYPPVPLSAQNVSDALARVPPIYRGIEADALPDVLRHDRMAVGYARQTSGPDKGLWRQVVRVFYASPFLARERRDDRLRAEAVCAQFLKLHALFQSALGLENKYDREGVTTIWLSEVSALWPADDTDPRIRQIIMPRINTPVTNPRRPGAADEIREIDVQPDSYPWRTVEGQNPASFGDLHLFRMAQKRDETEWLRQIAHEYGHAALPAFDNFKPPLEPYANGVLGESLGLTWAASAPGFWNLSSDFNLETSDDKTVWLEEKATRDYIGREVLPPLRLWLARGPMSPLRRDTRRQGQQYLQGFTTYIERVYGADVLGAAFRPLAEKNLSGALTTESLMASFPAALRQPFAPTGVAPTGVLPIWLPGALEAVTPVEDFLSRANVTLKSGERRSGWLYVPAGASTLRVEWKAAAPNALRGDNISRTTPADPISPLADYAFDFDLKNRPGWQRLTFDVQADLEIVAAHFAR